MVDLGYLGIEKFHKNSVIPKKKVRVISLQMMIKKKTEQRLQKEFLLSI